MKIDDFDYNLPEELIAQKPADRRDSSRLLVVHRKTDTIEHKHFYDILDYLQEGDCLVLNDSRVIPARLFGRKLQKDPGNSEPGAKIEFLLIRRQPDSAEDIWETMVRPGRRLKPGDIVCFSGPGSDLPEEPSLRAEILDYGDDGTRIVRFDYEGIFMERLEEIGVTVGLITNRKDFPELGSWQGTCEWYINGEEVENSLFVYSVYEGGERNEYTIYFS